MYVLQISPNYTMMIQPGLDAPICTSGDSVKNGPHWTAPRDTATSATRSHGEGHKNMGKTMEKNDVDWVNENSSLTWIKARKGDDFLIKIMIPRARSQGSVVMPGQVAIRQAHTSIAQLRLTWASSRCSPKNRPTCPSWWSTSWHLKNEPKHGARWGQW